MPAVNACKDCKWCSPEVRLVRETGFVDVLPSTQQCTAPGCQLTDWYSGEQTASVGIMMARTVGACSQQGNFWEAIESANTPALDNLLNSSAEQAVAQP